MLFLTFSRNLISGSIGPEISPIVYRVIYTYHNIYITYETSK